MISPARYAVVLKLCLLIAAGGRIAYLTGNGQRLDVMLANCSVAVGRSQPTTGGSRQLSCEWDNCEDLVRELSVTGGMLLAGAVPVKKPPESDG